MGTVTAAGAVGLAGCPDDGGDGTETETPTETEAEMTPTETATETMTQPDDADATIQVSSLEGFGSILVDSEGMTVYMFTADTQGEPNSTCPNFDQCDQYWPPVTVSSEEELSAGGGVGADLGVFEREGGQYDGQLQVTANGWPLYYFEPDQEPGDANGVGINDAWYPVSWEGEALIPTPATVQVSESEELGEILVGPDGRTLYNFDQDEQGSRESVCYGDCADAWPPLTVDNRNELEVGENVDAEVTTLQRENGDLQVVVNGWPVYYFVNDEEAGDTNGQGVNEVWWVLSPSGVPKRPGGVVQVAEHEEYGEMLVDDQGMSVYMFDADTKGGDSSACPGIEGCDEAWPPVTVESADQAEGGSAVTAELSTIEREDGTLQVTANGWPLYYFVNDEEPGDVAGQAVNDVWWVLRPGGIPIKGEQALVQVRDHEELGPILVDSEGMTIYQFAVDAQGGQESSCPNYAQCDQYWPSFSIEGEGELSVGTDVTASLDAFERTNGEYAGEINVTVNGWPTYYFLPDEEPGDAEGVGNNDVWWPFAPNGEPIQDV